MPITIKTGALKYKNAQGGYTGFNAIAQETSEQQIADIQSVGATQVSAVQQKGAETIASIPDDYTALSDDVSDLKSALTQDEKTIYNEIYSTSVRNPYESSTIFGKKISSDGGSQVTDASYNINRYILSTFVGKVIKVVSEYNFAFYTGDTIVTQELNSPVYEAGEYWLVVPSGTNSLLMSVLATGSSAKVYTTNKKQVATSDITDGAVTTAKLDDGAVTTAKLDSDITQAITNNTNDVENLENETERIVDDIEFITGNNILDNWGTGHIALGSSPTSLTPSSNTNYKCQLISCSEGDKFTITGQTDGSSAKLYGFITSEGVILETASSSSLTNQIITAPENTDYLVLNYRVNYTPPIVITGTRIPNQFASVKADITRLESQIADIDSSIYTFTKRRGVVSFIFDDGNANDTKIKSIFDTNNAKCGFAVFPNIASRYADYHEEGFEILAHANAPVEDPTEAKERTQMLNAYNSVIDAVGECHGWVTPSSELAQEYRPLVYDYYKYGYTIYKGHETVPANACMAKSIKTYEMWRASLEYLTLQQQKDMVDYALANNLMLCFYGHSSGIDTTTNLTTANLNALLAYCQTIGIKVDTPYNAIKEFMAFRHNEDYVSLLN